MSCDYLAQQHDYKYFYFLSVIMLVVGYSYSPNVYTFIDAPPGGATNYSFDGERLFILYNRIGDIYN